MPLFRTASSYRRRNALLSSAGVLIGIALFLGALIVFMLQLFAPGILAGAAAPVWRLGNGATDAMRSLTAVFGNAPSLAKERDRLAEENLALHEENRTLTGRVTDLERLIGTTSPQGTRIVAGVLARPPVSPYDTLIVGAGSSAGIKDGALAYGPGGVPIGKVAGVTVETARIELFSMSGRTTEGWIGEKRIPVTLTGKGAGAFEATLPRNSGVAQFDVVYVPGPGALPIGTVVKVDSNPSSPRDTVFVAPYANLFSMTWVELSP